MKTPDFSGMSKTKVLVQDSYELKQVADRVGCIINLASKAYSFPCTVTVYGISSVKEMDFQEFKTRFS